MAGRFWVGGTGTWDASTTTHWATGSGLGGGATVPGVADDVIFDGASGGGTITITTNPTIKSLNADAFTGTLGNATDNYNMTISSPFGGWSDFGTAVHTINMGLGTWTISAAEGTSTVSVSGANLTLNANSSTLVLTGSANNTVIRLGKTFNAVQINSAGKWNLLSAGTVATLSISPGVFLAIAAGATLTITTAPTWTGTRAAPIVISADNGGGGDTAAIVIGSGTLSLDWGLISAVTASGGTAFNATNSVSYATTTGWTIVSGPSAGSGGSHMIGS